MQTLEQNSIQLVAEVTAPESRDRMQYVIDRDELLHLKKEKLISPKFYVFLAIKLTYATSKPSIDIDFFCDQWGLKESEFHSAIAQLHKQEALEPRVRQLTLEIF